MGDPDGVQQDETSEEEAIILAAVDTSTLASRVLDLSARVARRMWGRAQLHVVHVFKHAAFDRPASVGLRGDDLAADAQSHLDHYLRMARRQFGGPVTGHFMTGDPVEQILARARSLAADWIIVGTHDPVGLERLLIGSVAQKVAERAPCPVLVVRPKQRPYVKSP